ncbi:hypothetical protein [Streptomyces sp. NPDC054783]
MTDHPSHRPGHTHGASHAHGPGHTHDPLGTEPAGPPRWVKRFLVSAGVAVAAFLAIHLAGGGMSHMGGH